jgi:hypothetical protein
MTNSESLGITTVVAWARLDNNKKQHEIRKGLLGRNRRRDVMNTVLSGRYLADPGLARTSVFIATGDIASRDGANETIRNCS